MPNPGYQTAIGPLRLNFFGAPSLLRLIRNEYPTPAHGTKGQRVDIHFETKGYDDRIRKAQYFSSPETLVIALPKRFMLVGMFRSKTWEVRVQLAPRCSDRDALGYIANPLVSTLLNRFEAILFHASAVTKKGRALAFLGTSGSGKSTTAFLLSRSGYTMAEDDRVPLFKKNHDFYFYSQHVTGYLTDRSLSLFPELRDLKIRGRVKKGTRTKSEIHVTPKDGKACRLSALFFPQITSRKVTSVKQLSEKEALKRLRKLPADDHPGRFPDYHGLANYISLTWALAASVPFYELKLGTDSSGLVKTIDAVAESLLE